MALKQPKQKNSEEALSTLMDRCARTEICCSDARRLMIRWEIPPEEQQQILERLIRERFIDEERYAAAFVRDKLNFSRWGSRKISEALYQKRIPSEIIKAALQQTTEVAMAKRLETDLERKNKSLKDEDPYKRKEKLLRFGISRGYDYETVTEVIERLSPPKE